MSFFDSLRSVDPASPVAFHLEGLIDASDRIRRHIELLDQLFCGEAEPAAEVLVQLNEEIYTHLRHHLKHLRGPLQELVDTMYQKISDPPDGEPSPAQVPPA